MVTITIFVEGGEPSGNLSAMTVDNSLLFRENFHKLFSQTFGESGYNISVRPFGSVHQAKETLGFIQNKNIQAVLLIDLDAPKAEREKRLTYYKPFDTSNLFFMIQEMEAWILSQPEVIEKYAEDEEFKRKREEECLAENMLITWFLLFRTNSVLKKVL